MANGYNLHLLSSPTLGTDGVHRNYVLLCKAQYTYVSIYPYPSGYVYPPISLSVRGVVIVNKYSCYATAIGSHCDTPVLATAMLV